MTIRPARAAERKALEELQRRSSVHDPMYRAQLAAHPDAIELPASQIAAGLVRVAEQDGAIAGFSVLLERSGDGCELDGLFVEPDRMRAGVGRRLIEDATRLARERGATRIDVAANPQAVAFYAAVGFGAVGEVQTRFGPAPRMSLPVTARASGVYGDLRAVIFNGTPAPGRRRARRPRGAVRARRAGRPQCRRGDGNVERGDGRPARRDGLRLRDPLLALTAVLQALSHLVDAHRNLRSQHV